MDRTVLCTNDNLTAIFKSISKNNNSGVSKDDILKALPGLVSYNNIIKE
jgi:hypothetical protein